jgi:surfactin synthase thioesterase subunit
MTASERFERFSIHVVQPERRRKINRSQLSLWVKGAPRHTRPRLRLFCYPYAGGGASVYRQWSTSLPKDVEVCSIQLPGREERLAEPPFVRLEPLVQTLVQVLGPYIDEAYAFWGHSMGALVAFELVRELRKQKLGSPARLYISAHRAPHLASRHPTIHHLPDAEFRIALERFDSIPQAVFEHSELRQLVLPTLRADFAVCETYRYIPDRPLDCPIVAFGGLNDREVSREELGAWQSHTHSPFSLKMLPGDHFFIQTANVSLLNLLSQDLSRLL